MNRNNKNGRTLSLINKIDSDYIVTSIYNKVLYTDTIGLITGISNSIGNFLKDVDGKGTYVFFQITSDDVQFKLNSNIVLVTDSIGTVLTNSNVKTTQVNYLSNVTSD